MLQGRFLIAAAAVALGAISSVSAQPTAADDLNGAVRLAADRGELLYIYDQAAWHGTDDFLGQYSHLKGEAGGYVVSGDENQTELTFYDKAKGKALYRATFSAGKLTKSGPPAPDRIALSPIEKQLISAKEKGLNAFMEAQVGLCNDARANLAALPPDKPGAPIVVYLMTSQPDLKTYPLGGHYSVEVGQDGSVSKVRAFAKSCLAMPLEQVPTDTKTQMFTMTHLLDPTPTEIHVFTSLASKMTIVVATVPKGRLWVVEGKRIQSAGQLESK